jgi:hypothetical protein
MPFGSGVSFCLSDCIYSGFGLHFGTTGTAGGSDMPNHNDAEVIHAGTTADLCLHLWESLVHELIARGTFDQAALSRILDRSAEHMPSLFNSAELRRTYDQLRARLERGLPTPLDQADRDQRPDTPD